MAFTAGSLIATMVQGIALGALLQSIRVAGRQYGGGWLDWLTPFSLLAGASVMCGYALLGVRWLILKTEWGQTTAPATSQWFMLVGSAVMIPIILIYTGWAYYVFRGKVGEGYH